MARCPSPLWQATNLDDSDETCFSPDIDKHPDEARILDDVNDVDLLFERTYENERGPTAANFVEFSEDAAIVPDQRCLPLSSDETFFEISRDAQRLPDSDETFFEPAHHDADLDGGRLIRCPLGGRTASSASPPVAEDVPRHTLPAGDEECSMFKHDLSWSKVCCDDADEEEEEEVCEAGHDNADEDDLYVQMPDPVTQEMVVFRVSGAQDFPDTMKILTQDFGWTQSQLCAVPFKEDPDSRCLGQPERTASPEGRPQAPDTVALLTQDLDWTQTQLQFRVAGPDLGYTQSQLCAVPFEEDPDSRCLGQPERTASPEGRPQAPDTVALLTQDLDWTQTQLQFRVAGPDLGCRQSPEQTMDLGSWSAHRSPSVAASSDQAMDVGSGGNLQHGLGSGDQGEASMEVGSGRGGQSMDASSGGAARPDPDPVPPGSSSLEFIPQCQEAGRPPPPSPLWPLLFDDQFNIEEIVASLNNISFHLDDGLCADVNGDGVVRDLGEQRPCPLSPPPPPPMPPSQPRSPTFSAAPHRRRYRSGNRVRTSRTAGPSVAAAAAAARDDTPAVTAPDQGTGVRAKRKRPGVGGADRGSGCEQQQQQPSPSPQSPPRQKSRRTGGAAQVRKGPGSKGRAEMIAVYSRLQGLRFLLQDILCGREALPDAGEVARMQQQVADIIVSMEQAAADVGNRHCKGKLKREQARQVADKLLHQLQVLAESWESQGIADESSEGNIQVTSWSDPAPLDPSESTPADAHAESNICSQGQYFPSCPQADQSEKTDITAKQTKAKRGKNAQQKGIIKKNETRNKHESCTEDSQDEKNTTTVCDGLSSNDIYKECSGSFTRDKNNEVEEDTTQFDDALEKTICHQFTSREVSTEIPQNEICLETAQTDVHPKTECVLTGASEITEHCGDVIVNRSIQTIDQDILKQEEYQQIVGLIKTTAAKTLTMRAKQKPVEVQEDFVWRGGPLILTGILLPKKSELAEINDLPQNFWGDPQALIPDEWIRMLEWDD